MSRCLLTLLVLLWSGMAFAQEPIETASGFQPECWAIVNARVVVSPEVELKTATVVIRKGTIAAVGKDVAVPLDAAVIEGKGLTVYAGFVDAATTLLIDPEKGQAVPTGRPVDYSRQALAATPIENRKGLTPEFQAADNLKYDRAIIEARRRAGYTSLHILPLGRTASGQGIHISTSGAPQREALIKAQTWSSFELNNIGGGGYPGTPMGAMAHLRQALLDTRRHVLHQKLYAQQVAGVERPPDEHALDALAQVTERKIPPVFTATSRDAIHRTLDFCEEMQLPAPALLGGREAYTCLERLKTGCPGLFIVADFTDEPKVEPGPPADKIVARIPNPMRVQVERRDRWKQQLTGLKLLADAKIRFALVSGSARDVDLLRATRLAINAGLPRSSALAAITRDAAALLGQEARLGTLEAGRLGHVVVLTGPFDDERSRVRYVFTDGLKFEYNRNEAPVPPKEPAPVALEGRWQLEIEADVKTACSLNLRQSGRGLSGEFRSPQGDGKIISGRVDQTTVEFVVAIGAGANSLELKFNGTFDPAQPGKLSGTMKAPFGGAAKWSATLQSPPLKPNPNPVGIGIDTGEGAPVTGAAGPLELPTELESDWSKRWIPTGGNLLIRNGTILSGKEELAGTSVLIKGGKIAAIGKDLQPETGMAVIEAAGRYVMPGIIDTHSHIMFSNGMNGVNESTRSIVPEVRVKDVVRTDDPQEYRALAGGVTAIRMLHGSANVVGGQDAVVKLKVGEVARAHILWDAPQGVKFALGENVKAQTNRFPNTRLGVEATLNRAFFEALDYRRGWQVYQQACKDPAMAAKLLPPRRDLRLEALADIIEHQKFIHSHCYRSDEILMLLRVANGLGIKVWSLQHVLEGYKVAPEIVAHGASCSTFSDWWAYKMEAFDATPYNAALLSEAGANVVIKSDDPELIRHLYSEAAKLLRYGNLPQDAALRAITLNSARELHLDGRMGSLEVGKDADIALFNGHPLNGFSRCEMTIIDGEVFFVREKQPSAMSPAAAAASASAGPLVLAPPEVRAKVLNIPISPTKQYALVHATLHPVDAPDIADGTLLIVGDKITALGAKVDVPTGAQVVDASGLHVYPGLIDAGTTLGLTEVGRVDETHDYEESGLFQPDLRAAVAVNPDSELIPVARAGGLTTTYIRPSSGVISGQGSIIRLSGWTAPEMAVNLEAALQVNWRDDQVEKLREFLDTGRLYHKIRQAALDGKIPPPVSDPRYDALGPYLRGEKRVFIEVNARQPMIEALEFAEKQGLKVVITGGADAWKIAAELKRRDVPVILGPVMRAPEAAWDPFDAPYAAAGRLQEAGVKFCIRSNHASNCRNVPFEAAMAAAYGLPQDVALKAVTLSAAQVLQIDQTTGSLTAGKLADLIVTDGSPLQQSTQIKAVFVAGKPYPPESRHTRLYQKYRGRLDEVRAQKQ